MYAIKNYFRKTYLFKKLFFIRSPVFNAMFIHNMSESQKKEIDIEDLEIETVQDMLKY